MLQGGTRPAESNEEPGQQTDCAFLLDERETHNTGTDTKRGERGHPRGAEMLREPADERHADKRTGHRSGERHAGIEIASADRPEAHRQQKGRPVSACGEQGPDEKKQRTVWAHGGHPSHR